MKLVPTLANCRDRELIQNDAASSRKWTRSVISPTARAATDAASSDLRIQEQVVLMLFLHSRGLRPAPVVYKAQSKVSIVECRRKRVVYELACRKSCAQFRTDQSDLNLMHQCGRPREAGQSVQTYFSLPLAPPTGNKNTAGSRD